MDYKKEENLALSALKPKSDSAVVRQMLDEIETALAAGVSRESIWMALCDAKGLSLSFKGFTQAVFRARQARDGRTVRRPVSRPLEAPSPVPSSPWLAPAAAPPRPGLFGRLSGLINRDGSSS
jgi:hypothetical protein